MALRNIPTDLQEVFSDNIPFTYAHLIKFERPSTVSQYLGIGDTDPTNYTYITDAAYDIIYNDGTGNGPQVYRSNKVLKVGSTNETVKAKASSITVQLDSSTMDSQAIEPRFITLSTAKGGIGTLNATGATNFVELGFREGDKATIRSSNGSFDGVSVIIRTFINEGNGFTYTAATTMPAISISASAYVTSIDLVSEELTALTASKGTTEYSSYINREVFVYKVFMATEHTALVGTSTSYNPGQIFGGLGTNTDPQGGLLLFKGIVSNASLTEGPKTSIITWTAASHWADFNRIQGRRTEDTSHRAVNSDGLPDRASAIREAYADDLGFAHSTTSVNLTAVYNRTETKTEVDIDKNWYGGVEDVQAREVEYDVPTELDLKFNLQAKYIPIVYGVQRVDTIPTFVDTRNHDSKEVHMTYAIAEGTVTGLYDIHLDGNSSICTDTSDFDVRGTVASNAADADGVIDFICRGRQDRGDVLGGYVSTDTANAVYTSSNVNEEQFSQNQNLAPSIPLADSYIPPDFTLLNNPLSNTGLLHGRTVSYDNPISAHLTFHQGTPYQKANDRLVEIAQSTAVDEDGVVKNFKIQNDYYTKKEVYYGPNHRLLDTSYLHAQYEIADGETNLPKFKTVIKGKAIECHNYDNSFAQDTRTAYASADHTNFELGNEVTLKVTGGTATFVSGTFTIVDKWFFYNTSGVPQYRFRLKDSTTGVEPVVPDSSSFYMLRGAHRWYLNTNNESSVLNASVSTALESNTSSAGNKTITLSSPASTVEGALSLTGVVVKLRSSKNSSFLAANFGGISYSSISNVIGNLGTITWDSSITKVVVGNGIILPSAASDSNNFYNGAKLVFTRTLTNGTTYVQERNIIDYHGTQRVAIVDAPWDSNYIPGYDLSNAITGGTDTVSVLIGSDMRASTNPAMQLLDYLKSKRYGKGLKDADIDLPSFLSAAKACDLQSDISVVVVTGNLSSVAKGDKYRYGTPGSARGFFQGTISDISVGRTIENVSYTQIDFTDVIGKLGSKWNDYTQWATGELIWNSLNGQLRTAASTTASTGTFSGQIVTAMNLTKVSGAGPTLLPLDVTVFKAGNNNPVVKSYTTNFNSYIGSGYSLYDADDIKYWKYIGWDEPTQRHATRHQMNQSINTSQPIFGNVNKMLEQFNGVLRYSLGKYQLAIRGKKGTIAPLEKLSEGDIIGNIKITDNGSKKTYNSANLSFPDPQNKFENRDVAFYNSEYLKEDKGIPKNLSYQARGITNYFNARFNLVQKLKESRSGTTINLKVGPRGYALLPGEVIQLTYPRFGWADKDFRISSINYTTDCLATITATEHNDSAFVVEAAQNSLDTQFTPGGLPIKPTPDAPSNLAAAAPSPGGIALTWLNSPSFSPKTHTVQIWKSDSNTRSVTQAITANSAPKAGTVFTNVTVTSSTGIEVGQLVKYRNSPDHVKVQAKAGNTITLDRAVEILTGTELVFFTATLAAELKEQVEYIDPIISSTNSVTRYYWARYKITEQGANTGSNTPTERYSPFHPSSTTAGVAGTSQPSGSPRSVKVFAGGSGISGNVVTYDVNSLNPTPSAITFTAVHQGVSSEANVSYAWFIATPGGSFASIGSDSATHAFTVPVSLSGLPKLFKCIITDTVGTATYTAEDVLEIYPTRVVADGESDIPGAPGVSSATVYAYARSTAASFTTKPDAITWTFGSASGSSLGSVYTYAIPSGVDPLYVSTAIASGTGSTDTIAANEWSAPVQLAQNGANTATVYAYRRSTSALGGSVKPSTARTWTFGTGVWNNNDLGNSFSGVIPGGTDELYACTAIATSIGSSDQVDIADWSSPQILGKVGGDGAPAFYVVSRLPSFGFSADSTGEINTLTGFQNTFTVREGTQAYTFDSTADGTGAYDANSYRYGTFTSSQTGGVDDITITTAADGTIGINTTGTPFKSGTSILDAHFDVQILNNNGNAVIATMRSSLTKSVPVAGTPAKTVSLRAAKQLIEYTAAGTHAINQTITLTAETQNFTTAYFKFTGNGISDEATWTTGDSANLDTFSFPIPTTYSATPYVITVSVKESGNTGAVIATDTLTISSLKPSTDGEDGTSGGLIDLNLGGDAAFSSTGVLSKTGTNTGWGSQGYSTIGYTSGTVVTFRAVTNNKTFMAGLDSSPSTNTFSSLDYVFYFKSDGTVYVYESNVNTGQVVASYSVGDIFSVVYDNQNVKYYHNGAVVRTVSVGEDRTFFFDTSLASAPADFIDSITIAPTGKAGGVGRTIDWNFTDMEIDDLGRLRKTGTTSGWNAQAYSTDAYTGGASVSFRGLSASKSYAMGLNTDPAAAADIGTLDYSFYLVYDGTVHLRLNNTSITNPATSSTTWLSSRSANDLFTVVYNNKDVKWYHNGVLLHTLAAAADKKFYVDSSQHSIGNEFVIDNVSFGPVGAAGTPGGTPELNFTNAAINDQGQIYKTSNTTSWNAQAYSTVGYSDGAVLTFKVLQHNRKLMVGFSETPATNASYTDIDYAIYLDGTGQRKAYEGGVNQSVSPAAASGQISTGDILSLVYDNSTVKYYHNSLLYRTAQVGAGKTFFLDSSFDNYNSGNPQIGNVTFSPSAAAGTDGITVVLSNETHALPASNSGAVSSFAGSGTTISVFEGTTQLAYDTTPTANGQFKVTSAHSGMSIPSIADGGNTAVVANFTAMAGDTGSATYTITGLRTDGSALPTIVKTQTFTKAKAGSDSTAAGSRGPGRFVIEESTLGTNTTGSDAAAFAASSFTNDFTSGRIAADIIALASDSKIQSGDIVTVTDNSANVSGTRIYNGNPTATSGNVDADDFSSLVVETIQGSAIVDGTLSAASIQSGTVTANDFTVGSTLTVGTASSAGSIRSVGKTSATSTTNGFFLGVDEDGDAEFAIGGGGNNSTLMNQNGIVVIDGAGTIRVALGNLTLLLDE